MAFKTTTNWKKYRLWCSEFMVFILVSFFFFFNAFHFFLFFQYLKFQIFFPSKKLALFDYLLLVLFFYRSLNQWWIFLFSAFIPVKASSLFSVQAKRKELIIVPISFSTRLRLISINWNKIRSGNIFAFRSQLTKSDSALLNFDVTVECFNELKK